MLIEYNNLTGYHDWRVRHLTGRCLTPEKAKRHAEIASLCLHMSIQEFHDCKNILCEVDKQSDTVKDLIRRLI